jgi:hypothetical protein
MAVERHGDASSDSKLAAYDITVRIDDTAYIVLYATLHGEKTAEYAVGHEFLSASEKIASGSRKDLAATPSCRSSLPIKRRRSQRLTGRKRRANTSL